MTALESVASELIRGRDSAVRIATVLREASQPDPSDEVLAIAGKILRCFDRALVSLGSRKNENVVPGAKKRKIGSTTRSSTQTDASKTVVVRETEADAYRWRKYGEKVIMNSKFPRCYYRCTYKFDQNCQAMKQVQQSDENPSKYVITYVGKHTCVDATADVSDESGKPFMISFDSSAVAGGDPFSSSLLFSDSRKGGNGEEDVVNSVSVGGCSLTATSQLQMTPAVAGAMSELVDLRMLGCRDPSPVPGVQSWEFESSFDMDDCFGCDPFGGLFQH